MVKYKCYKEQVKEDFFTFGVLVEPPFEYLSMIFEGTEKSEKVELYMQGIEKVKNGISGESFSIENQQGFISYAFAPGLLDKEYPNGGFQVFDFYSLDKDGSTKLMFVISLGEILKLLKDFKAFLIGNGR